MQSGNGMTMQEAEQEIKYYQKIFQVVRLLKGEDVERTFYQQGKGTCENVQDGCPCYSFWKKNGKCENCSSYKALREKKQMIKLEFLESEVYQVISRYMEIDGQPYVMELINHLEDDTLICPRLAWLPGQPCAARCCLPGWFLWFFPLVTAF